MVVLAAIALLVGGISMGVTGDWQLAALLLVMGVLSALLAAWHLHALRRLRESERT